VLETIQVLLASDLSLFFLSTSSTVFAVIDTQLLQLRYMSGCNS
jgi:hypothetical protein